MTEKEWLATGQPGLRRELPHACEVSGEWGKAEAIVANLETLANDLVRYILFADEVPLLKGDA